MAEELILSEQANKQVKYEELLPQLSALVEDETDLIANMANTAAALYQTFRHFWIGFYIVKGDQLVLGPFQGPIACTRINKGKGVCGTVWEQSKTMIVSDVDKFPGHIACNGASRSEIVIPGFNPTGEVSFVLDIDSDQLDDFDQTDQVFLEKIIGLLS
jgi:L-methionine (R)-S-oxide reductase